MNKIRARINENDRIVIDIIDCQSIQYVFVESRTGKKTLLAGPTDFSLSVKKYFGVQDKKVKE